MGIRKLVVGMGALGASLALGASAAWACTNLATLNLSSASGTVGQSITVTGSSFHAAQTGPQVPVVLHWNSVSGPALATATPDATGNISATIAVPQANPGYYVIVAVQQATAGVDEYGTPARAAFEVITPGQHPAVTPNAGQSAGVATTSPSSTGVIALTVALGVAGLALFGAGAASFARQARRRAVPATQKAGK
ncbi:MAG: hypothetical protein ACRDYC_03790 [Acidimicrobiales bacterium]